MFLASVIEIKKSSFQQWVMDYLIVSSQSNTRWVLKWNLSFYSHKWKYKSKSIATTTITIYGERIKYMKGEL
jgi:hypothetical protein